MDDRHRCDVNSLVETPCANPINGLVRWDPVASLWNGGMMLAATTLAPLFVTWAAVAV